jgi:DNA-directed RNA polymerase subunit beta'
LTMRTFHTGGIASASDITQGLPRVEELFEGRRPKNSAIITEISGIVRMEEIKRIRNIFVTSSEGDERQYQIPYGFRINVEEGATVVAGDALTDGPVNPHDVLAVKGEHEVQNYLIAEVQKVYRMQGVDINDKHIEVIVRQMMRKVRIVDPAQTELLAGATADRAEIKAINKDIRRKNKVISERIAAGEEGLEYLTEIVYEPILLGITKASLATDSFLSAASFQETTRVLTDAAIKGKIDPLLGLKENVIIGKLIPAGTGMPCYRNVEVVKSNGELQSL